MTEPSRLSPAAGSVAPSAPRFVFDGAADKASASLKPQRSSSQPTSPKMPTRSSSQPTSPNLRASAQQSGSATGNPRNKCALQPGHSLMDWIRLGNSGRDLTGVGGRLRPVSYKELAQHNTTGDAWIAIRGRVYNVTHYLPYHPGGPDELMRGTGTDATQLFDKVHPWVNYESLLVKCLVGPLRGETVDAAEFFGELPATSVKSSERLQPSKAQELVRKSMENLANCITPVRKRITRGDDSSKSESPPSRLMQSLVCSAELPVNISRAVSVSPAREPEQTEKQDREDRKEKREREPQKAPTPPPLRYDWLQTSTRLTVCVYTRSLGNPAANAHLAADTPSGVQADSKQDGDRLVLRVSCGGVHAIFQLIPKHPIEHPLALRVYPESGKVEVCIRKTSTGVWRGAGDTRWEGTPATVLCARRPATLRSRTPLTRDTVLLILEPRAHDADTPQAVHVPVGHHLKIHHTVNGKEVTRSYTPVCPHWSGIPPPRPGCEPEVSPALHLIVKRYEHGALSRPLSELEVGATVTLSAPYGNFNLQRLRRTRRAYLLAAGTGITPMLSLLTFLLARRNPKCDLIQLIFFNKKEEDIIVRDKLEGLAESDQRLLLTHVLSEWSATWEGERGRITSDLVRRIIPPDALRCVDICEHFAAACGPAEFTHMAQNIVYEKGMDLQCFHAFLG